MLFPSEQKDKKATNMKQINHTDNLLRKKNSTDYQLLPKKPIKQSNPKTSKSTVMMPPLMNSSAVLGAVTYNNSPAHADAQFLNRNEIKAKLTD